jgi:hypothetical protein
MANTPNYQVNRVSWGPAVLYLGAAGATPTVDVGAIAEDGVGFEFEVEKKEINQGNPKVPIIIFAQAQSVKMSVTGIEWNFTNLAYALGAGNTTVSGTQETFAFGGDPVVKVSALRMVHQMGSGQTMIINVWRATSDGGVASKLGQDEHGFPMTFKALNATTNWGGASLAVTERLVQLVYQTA